MNHRQKIVMAGILGAMIVSGGWTRSAKADVVTPEAKSRIEWSVEETALPIAARKLAEDERSGHWLVRLTASEKPHTHDADLTVFVLSGEAVVHYDGGVSYPSKAGDVVRIPRGMVHWAELAPGAVCEVYAVYVFEPKPEESHVPSTPVSAS